MSISEENRNLTLTNLGFENSSNSDEWVFNEKKFHSYLLKKSSIESKKCDFLKKNARIFEINTWKIFEKTESNFVHDISISLKKDHIIDALNTSINLILGKDINRLIKITEEGDIWFLFEFSRPTTRIFQNTEDQNVYRNNLQSGLAGFKVCFTHSNNNLSLLFTDHFTIGYTPQSFIHSHILIFEDFFSIKSKDSLHKKSIFEINFSLEELAISTLSRKMNYKNDVYLETLNSFNTEYFNILGNASCKFFQNEWIFSTNISESHRKQSRKIKPPIYILESREFSKLYNHVDQLIISGEFKKAFKECEDLFKKNLGSVYLLRRLVLLKMIGFNSPYFFKLDESILKEPRNNLFLSHQVKNKMDLCEFKSALKFLSSLGEEILNSGLDIDTLPIFDVVFPELLGDLWLDENANTSVSCYERIIKKRGDIPRILRKLIQISNKTGNKEKEQKLLNRLIKVETRTAELSKIYLRQAIISVEYYKNKNEAIELALRSLQFDRKQFKASIILSDILCEFDRADEAIDILDNLINDTSSGLSNEIKAKYQCKIAQIWSKKLDRDDLAIQRYENAISLDQNCKEATEELKKIYKDEQNPESLIRIIENDFIQNPFDFTEEEHWDYFRNLYNYYNSEKKDIYHLREIFQLGFTSIDINNSIIQRMMNYEIVDLDWKPLLNRVKQKISSNISDDEKYSLSILLGDIYKDKIKNLEKACDIYLEANSLNDINPTLFNFLIEQLILNSKQILAIDLLRKRLQRQPNSNKKILLDKLYNLSDFMNEFDKGELYLEIYKTKKEFKIEVQKHLVSLKTSQNFKEMHLFFEKTYQQLDSDLSKSSWMEFWIELISEIDWNEKIELLKEGYDNLIVYHHDISYVLKNAVQYFLAVEREDILQHFVVISLEHEILPKLQNEKIEHLLQHNKNLLAKFYELNSNIKNQDSEIFMKKSVDLFLQENISTDKTFENISNYSLNNYIEKKVIDKLRLFVESNESWNIYSSILDFQLSNKALNGEDKEFYQIELINILIDKLALFTKAKTVLEQMVLKENNAKFILFRSLEIANSQQDHKNISTIKDQLLSQIFQISNLQNISKEFSLAKFNSSDTKIINKHFYKLILEKFDLLKLEDLISINSIYEENSIRSNVSNYISFINALNKQIHTELSQKWFNIISDLNSPIIGEDLIIGYLNYISTHDNILLLDIYNILKTKNISDYANSEVAFYANTYFALSLFNSGLFKDESLEFLDILTKKYPKNRNFWLPYYLLSRELGQKNQKIRSLNLLIKNSASNPDVLESSPFTLEYLKGEFKKIAGIEFKSDEKEETFFEDRNVQKYITEVPTKQLQHKEIILSLVESELNIEKSTLIKDGFSKIANAFLDIQTENTSSINANIELKAASGSESFSIQTPEKNKPKIKIELPKIPKLPEIVLLNDVTENQKQEVHNYINNALENRLKISSILENNRISDLEKHILCQVVAIKTRDFSEIENLQWKPWISLKDCDYQKDNRFNELKKIKLARPKSPLFKLIMYLTPILVRLNRELFTFNGLADYMQLSPELLGQRVKRISLNENFLEKTGLEPFFEKLQIKKYKFFDLQDLKEKIFYDGVSKSLFVDLLYYKSLPKNTLRNAIIYILYAVEMQYYPLVQLSPEAHIYPILEKIHKLYKEGKGVFDPEDQLIHLFEKLPLEKINNYYGNYESPTFEDVERILIEIPTMINKKIFLKTIDLISIVEYNYKCKIDQINFDPKDYSIESICEYALEVLMELHKPQED